MQEPGLASRVLDALQKAGLAHEAGRVLEVFADDDLEAAISADSSDYQRQFAIVREFLLGWADCAGHDFQYYPGFAKDDWPRLASQIAEDILASRPIGDPTVLAAFAPRPPSLSLWARVRKLLGF
jgi:hypothetical protein